MKGRQLGLVDMSAAPHPEPLLKLREGACRPLVSGAKMYIEETRRPKQRELRCTMQWPWPPAALNHGASSMLGASSISAIFCFGAASGPAQNQPAWHPFAAKEKVLD